MTNDEINRTLQRIFPGDPVPDVSEDTHWSDEPVSWRVSAPPTRVRHVESPRVKARPVSARTSRFAVDRSLPPVVATPSVPTRAYLIEDKAHVTRWLEEAKGVESDAKLGQEVETHQVTRLLLEAIPVVQQFARDETPT